MTQIRATIIIPAYNAAKTLEKAVVSALAQTEKNIEIIIVDDGSSDNTWDIATALAKRDPRIKPSKLPQNRGKPFVMNHATDLAQGEWIAILDADDWFIDIRLEKLIALAEVHNVEMVADNLFYVDTKADAIAGTAFPNCSSVIEVGLDEFLQNSDPTLQYDYGMLQPIFRANFIRGHQIEYYEPARIGEDYYVLLCFFIAGGRALVVDEPYYYYAQPYGSISRQWAQEGRKRYNYELLKKVHDHFVAKFKDQLQPAQLQRLDQRGVGILTMLYYHQIKESLAAHDMIGAIKHALAAPAKLWRVIVKKIVARICAP